MKSQALQKVAAALVLAAMFGFVGVDAQARPKPQQNNVAQPQTGQQAQTGQQVQVTVNDEDLKNFAKAIIAVEKIKAEYRPKVADIKDDQAQLETLNQEATRRMVQTVEGFGLSIEKYQLILQAARQDEAFKERVNKHIEEEQKKAAG